MAHVCLFPELTNGGPIYGFDIIAGKKKVTGAFHDFSPLLQKQHPLTEWFKEEVKWYKPSKERELPDWAKAIFSGGMIAAGNVQEEKELNQICTMAVSNLANYIDKIKTHHGEAKKEDVIRHKITIVNINKKTLTHLELCKHLVFQTKILSYSVKIISFRRYNKSYK